MYDEVRLKLSNDLKPACGSDPNDLLRQQLELGRHVCISSQPSSGQHIWTSPLKPAVLARWVDYLVVVVNQDTEDHSVGVLATQADENQTEL